MKQRLIAFLGLPGSGKTEAISYVMEKYQWPKVYFGQITLDEVIKRGLEINPRNEQLVREDLRNVYGEDYHARRIVEKIEAMPDEPIILIESLYSWTEYQIFRERFNDAFTTITIHAAPHVRYARLANRKERPLTEEEAKQRDIAQLKRFDQGMPIALSDCIIINEGSVEDLHGHIEEILQRLNKDEE